VYANPVAEAVLTLASEHRVRSEEVRRVVVHCCEETVRYAAGVGAYRPATREAADHSVPYVVAIALIEGDVAPRQYERQQWTDPHVVELMARVECVVDPELDRLRREHQALAVRLDLHTDRGVLTLQVNDFRGHPKNPLDDDDVREKFRRVAGPRLTEDAADRVITLTDRLDELDEIDELVLATRIGASEV
jgi:2-methylcitrate dehydratase